MFHVTIVLFVLQNFAAVWALKREILANRAGQKGQRTSQGRKLGHTGAASECTASKRNRKDAGGPEVTSPTFDFFVSCPEPLRAEAGILVECCSVQ